MVGYVGGRARKRRRNFIFFLIFLIFSLFIYYFYPYLETEEAKPSDKGNMNIRPTMFIAIVCAANDVEPNIDIIRAAPLNMLNSTKIPKLIGVPIRNISMVFLILGNKNFP